MKIDCTTQNMTNRGEAFGAISQFTGAIRSGCHSFSVETSKDPKTGTTSMTIKTTGKSLKQEADAIAAAKQAAGEKKEAESLRAEIERLKEALAAAENAGKTDSEKTAKTAK
ncbi:hypothetical protein FF011L_47250 [Roseimaritima multifibrata]|uniref:Uncharacterized protein n=1 Tax=Roseimaritima multifibrata TaxID=1930274 RepID=A0A517MM08_9BACT|nr:hypothetical protein [Roseimaritima multifibrata]QDS95924.1 hypothetical protein FF011L_47250 [Roseimaritima multifibrata]